MILPFLSKGTPNNVLILHEILLFMYNLLTLQDNFMAVFFIKIRWNILYWQGSWHWFDETLSIAIYKKRNTCYTIMAWLNYSWVVNSLRWLSCYCMTYWTHWNWNFYSDFFTTNKFNRLWELTTDELIKSTTPKLKTQGLARQLASPVD